MNSLIGVIIGFITAVLSVFGFGQHNAPAPQPQPVPQIVQQDFQQPTNISSSISATINQDSLMAVSGNPRIAITGTAKNITKVAVEIVDDPSDPRLASLDTKDLLFTYATVAPNGMWSADIWQTPAGTYQIRIYESIECITPQQTDKCPTKGVNLLASGILIVDGSQSSISVPGMSKYTDTDFGFSFWYPNSCTVSKKAPQVINVSCGSPSKDAVIAILKRSAELDTTSATKTMGGLPMLYESSGNLGTMLGITVPLNKNYAIDVTNNGGPYTYTSLVETIVATDSSVATPVSAAEQIKVIQAEKDAYAGQ